MNPIICENCNQHFSKCDCYDNQNAHSIIAHRNKHNYYLSHFIKETELVD